MTWGKKKTGRDWHCLDETGLGICRYRAGRCGGGSGSGPWETTTEEWPTEIGACFVCRGLLLQRQVECHWRTPPLSARQAQKLHQWAEPRHAPSDAHAYCFQRQSELTFELAETKRRLQQAEALLVTNAVVLSPDAELTAA